MIKNFIIWLIITLSLIFIFNNFNINECKNKIDYSTFINDLNKEKIKEVCINGKEIYVIKKNRDSYITYMPILDYKLLSILLNKNIKIIGKCNEDNIITSILISWSPIILILLVWIFFIRQIQIGGKGSIYFGKNKAKIISENRIKIKFEDVAGCDEAKEEVKEIVDFLKNPNKFKKLGGRIPKGILMIGPPGTGKTLLAKAIAGESDVPFFTISGSDFVEMFVGVGASRVRDMFDQAKKKSPSIIFIDEIDAVGRQRGTGFGGGHDEREQTLNQMLVEMDGFDNNESVIVIAATNRPDVLDNALLRPGRFDRKVIFDLPDIKGREEILKIHVKKINLNEDVDLSLISKSTSGFSGADLSNLVNEAILHAAKNDKEKIYMSDFEFSRDKIILGSERKSMILTNKQKEYIAYHESGHVIVGKLIPDHDPINKVTIIPRGRSLGVTLFLPNEEYLNTNRIRLESKISALYGGRLAEEIIYGYNKISTGSLNDIKVATSIARKMVIQLGYSKILGPLMYSFDDENESYMNNKFIFRSKTLSEDILKVIDQEIINIININYQRAKDILIKNIDILHSMKDALIKNETLNSNQINNLINRKPIDYC
ncbi:ATP-dependent zinc metalloprotease FtsH [endosymbiont of Sipalinus gigas]|uniref:ATP-dependent zinc metalloprotease FtsH n=1 Tax=endosymbiont of Sipalinus gigas TaxID=1972134 RepID=UPI000DC713A8|nr:ATP-dependent zinc metalloprotease FtsH [endosymbiont of Sipalinus gigas]BBA85373.1 ATP-dependent zinc metalloprotease FtsH [endosymbiont of Sipalinus gigas]